MGDYAAAEFMPGDAVRTDDEWLAYCREAGDTVPSGNINAAVIAVAEKGADLVKEA